MAETKKQRQLRERIERLEAQKKQAKASLAAVERRENERERRAETRRNVILGATIRAALDRGESVQISGDVRQWLDARLTRKQDREQWGLE